MTRIPNNQDLEKLFKTSFDNFEPEVNTDVWNKIQQNIPKGAIQAAAVTSGISKLASKLLIGAGSVATVIATLVYLNTDNKETATTGKAIKTADKVIIAPETVNEQPIALAENANNSNTIASKTAEKPFPLNKVAKKVQHTTVKTTPAASEQKQVTDLVSNPNSPARKQDEQIVKENTLTQAPIVAGNKTNKYDYSQDPAPANNSFITNNAKPAIVTTSHSGVFPLTITFSNKGGNRINKWDFGDGTFSTEKSPVHTYDKVGIYKVVLTSEDNSKDVQIIQVLSNIKVIAPNFFSPDGDGINDEFKVTSNDAQSLQVQILDLAGKEVGHIDSQEGIWNGKNLRNGEPCKPGAYLYIVSGTTIDGRQFEHRGSITLKR